MAAATTTPPRWRSGDSSRGMDSGSRNKSRDRTAAEREVGIDFENPLAGGTVAGDAVTVFESD